jgi:dTMP kinase
LTRSVPRVDSTSDSSTSASATGSGPWRSREHPDAPNQGFFAMLRGGVRFATSTPLIRGLVIGLIGAFAAGGAVVGSAQKYAQSVLGGDSSFGLLFLSLFVGLGTGMAAAPKLAQRMPRNRLFGTAIVSAGLALSLMALSPHLWFSLLTGALVGSCAGVAFLTGVTIVGTEVEDEIRGRTNALIQSLMKIVLFASTAIVPLLVGLVRVRTVSFGDSTIQVDGTRPVMFGAGIIAALVGVLAYRQMDDRRTEPFMSDLIAAIRRYPRRTAGMLIAVEGHTAEDTSTQARRLVDRLAADGHRVVLAADPTLDEGRLSAALSGVPLLSPRAHALVAAAVRADVVDQQIGPALDAGAIVVMERYLNSQLARLGAAGGMEPDELEDLADWATGRLRPDVTVLLDRDPATLGASPPRRDRHWRVQQMIGELAVNDPDRCIVVDADAPEDVVAQRVLEALEPVLAARPHPEPLPEAL